MAHANLGRKRRCTSCGIKFYDFNKSPAICPECGTEFDPEVLLKSRRGRINTKDDVPKPVVKDDEVSDEDLSAKPDEVFESDDDVLSDEDELKTIKTDEDKDDEDESSGAALIDVLDENEDAADEQPADEDEEDV